MISLKNLPFKNLKGYSGRTAALIFFSALMSVAIFGGSLIIAGVRQGLNTVEARLGADIMVTPESAKNDFDAQTVLLQAEPGYFYMEKSKVDEIAKVDGVDLISPQVFMASTKAGCCSARLQMIAYDPATDFTIQPWIADTYTNGDMGLMDVVVGSDVTVYKDRTISFYDNDCHIVGQFDPTGSTLDSCVYMNFDTVKKLIDSSFVKGMNLYSEYDPDDVVSAVMVRVKPGADIEEVAANIQKQVSGVTTATSRNMVSGIGESLSRVAGTVGILIAAFGLVGILMTVLVFVMMINERKGEFEALKAVGADRKLMSGIVAKEAVMVNLAGGIIGIALSGMILIMFRSLFETLLGAGFVIPGPGVIALMAAAALLAVMVSAAVSSFAAVRRIGGKSL